MGSRIRIPATVKTRTAVRTLAVATQDVIRKQKVLEGYFGEIVAVGAGGWQRYSVEGVFFCVGCGCVCCVIWEGDVEGVLRGGVGAGGCGRDGEGRCVECVCFAMMCMTD